MQTRPLVFFFVPDLPHSASPAAENFAIFQNSLISAGYLVDFRPNPKRASEDWFRHLNQRFHDPEVDREQIYFVGLNEGSDFIANRYFDLFAINPPEAVVLISPTIAGEKEFSQISCPCLLLDETHDLVGLGKSLLGARCESILMWLRNLRVPPAERLALAKAKSERVVA